MEYSSTTPIAITVILVLVAALFVWLSLTMAAAEGAVARVTRASLNNLILEVQTDSEASQFLKMKKIDKIHRVQRAHRRPLRHRRQLCVLPHRLQCARRRTGVFHRIPVGCGTVD